MVVSLTPYVISLKIQDLPNLIRGKGDSFIGTSVLEGLAGVHPEFDAVSKEYSNYRKQEVMYNLNRITNGTSSTFSSMRDSGTAADLATPTLHDTVAQDAGARLGQVAREFTSGLTGSGGFGFGAIKAGMAAFGGMWALSSLTRSGPTPESTTRNGAGEIQDIPMKGMLQQQVARVTPNENGEQVNISISNTKAANMSHDQIASLVHNELSAMMPMQLNMNMNVRDNTQTIDKQYLQGIVSQSLSTGRVIG
jgi:hypothetical protein